MFYWHLILNFYMRLLTYFILEYFSNTNFDDKILNLKFSRFMY
jgi:hypothetical protein